MSRVDVLCQRSERWARVNLGASVQTIGDYGCLLTCGAMLHGYDPLAFQSMLLAAGGFAGAYIRRPYWQMLPKGRRILRDVGEAGEYRLKPFPSNEIMALRTHLKNGGLAVIEVNFRAGRRTRALDTIQYLEPEAAQWHEQMIADSVAVRALPAYSQHFLLACAVQQAGVMCIDPWTGDYIAVGDAYGGSEAAAICRALILQ